MTLLICRLRFAGTTPLHRSCQMLHHAGVLKLLDSGADPASQTTEGETPLHIVAAHSAPQRLQQLLNRGADVTLCTSEALGALTAMQVACAHRDPSSTAILLEAGSDPNVSDGTGNTPLHLMTEYGYSETVAKLLKAGATPSSTNDDGTSPLQIAVNQLDAATAQLLLDAGAETSITDAEGRRPLHVAALSDSAELVQVRKITLVSVSVVDFDCICASRCSWMLARILSQRQLRRKRQRCT